MSRIFFSCFVYSMTDSPAKLLQAGKFNKSNIIVGVTRDDGSVFVNAIPGWNFISLLAVIT